jgi:class 3 adenylate cyclase
MVRPQVKPCQPSNGIIPGQRPGFDPELRSAPKWCSRQAEFHHILGRRSPCGLAGEMSEARVERRLAAILAVDVAGYSRLMGADGEGTLAALRAIRRELSDPKIAEHRGRIVKTTGDGLLAEFASVVDAVRCAVEVQREMIARNAATPAERRIDFRMGINVGDIIIEDGDIFGDGVNIAARLEALAEPGGICLSAAAHEQVRDRFDIAFDDLGEQSLKNIAQPIRVYRVESKTQPEERAGIVEAPLALPDKPSIAVLPFQNLSGDLEQEYFADGMVEEIITALSQIRWLFVIARNSNFSTALVASPAVSGCYVRSPRGTASSTHLINSGGNEPASAAATHSASSCRFLTPSTSVSISSDSA